MKVRIFTENHKKASVLALRLEEFTNSVVVEELRAFGDENIIVIVFYREGWIGK